MSRSRPARRKTLWEEGHTPGRLVRTVTATILLAVALLETLLLGHLGWLFDITFVLTCIGAALLVRPRDFFMVGVLPPLAMLVIVVVLAAAERGAVADPGDGLIQATVSGLAHHAGALVVGYTLTLVILALRQVAARHAGTIRSSARPAPAPATRPATAVPPQRGAPAPVVQPSASTADDPADPTTEAVEPLDAPLRHAR